MVLGGGCGVKVVEVVEAVKAVAVRSRTRPRCVVMRGDEDHEVFNRCFMVVVANRLWCLASLRASNQRHSQVTMLLTFKALESIN